MAEGPEPDTHHIVGFDPEPSSTGVFESGVPATSDGEKVFELDGSLPQDAGIENGDHQLELFTAPGRREPRVAVRHRLRDRRDVLAVRSGGSDLWSRRRRRLVYPVSSSARSNVVEPVQDTSDGVAACSRSIAMLISDG